MNRNELRYLRLKNRLTQAQISNILEIPSERYSLIERGYSYPTEDELEQLATFFVMNDRKWEL